MAGLAVPIKLREFNIRNPQFTVDDVYPGKVPRRGTTVGGLYVCQVGRVHPDKPDATVVSRNSKPDIGEPDYYPIPYRLKTPFDTTYNKHFQSHYVAQDVKYTPTNHQHPLPTNSLCQPIVQPL